MTQSSAGTQHIVLAAVDYSQVSELALASVADMVRSNPKSEPHVVHVVHPSYPTVHEDQRTDDLQKAIDKLGLDAKKELPKVYGALTKDLGNRVVGHVCFGRPDREIVLLAGEIGADLIVLGTHGRTGVERVFLGSVAERVLRAAPCPVLAVRAKEAATETLIEPPRCWRAARRRSSDRAVR